MTLVETLFCSFLSAGLLDNLVILTLDLYFSCFVFQADLRAGS